MKYLERGHYNSGQTIIKVPHQFHAYNQRYFKNSKTNFVFEKEHSENITNKPNQIFMPMET